MEIGDGSLERKNFSRGEMIHFDLAPQVPRITIMYLNFGGHEDKDEEEHDLLAANLFAQICNLTKHEQYHLLEILPSLNTFIRVPFVTWVSSTSSIESLWYVISTCMPLLFFLLCPCISCGGGTHLTFIFLLHTINYH
jgi:hypothetical protein